MVFTIREDFTVSVVNPAHLEERTAWPEAANNDESTNQGTDGDHCDAGDHDIPANIQHNTYCMAYSGGRSPKWQFFNC